MADLRYSDDPLGLVGRRTLITLAQYVLRRNGVPLGASGSLQNMLRRSLGAGSFAGFWRHWNPVWGYGLARYVQSPLLLIVPPAAAIIVTFAVCGALHDLVIIVVRGSPTLFFTPWFILLGVGVVLGQLVGIDLSSQPWPIRALANLIYLGICLVLTVVARWVLAIP